VASKGMVFLQGYVEGKPQGHAMKKKVLFICSQNKFPQRHGP